MWPPFTSEVRVFVLPARTVLDDRSPKGEGFGIVFLEAMAFGKPVVGSNCGAPAELIRHGENGLLVIPEDPASVAEALVHLLTNPVTARNGKSWERLGAETLFLRILSRTVARYTPRAPRRADARTPRGGGLRV